MNNQKNSAAIAGVDVVAGGVNVQISAGIDSEHGDAMPAYARLGVSRDADGNVRVRTIQSGQIFTLPPRDVPLLIEALQSLHQIGSELEIIFLDPSL